jgi:hypothetical protein
VKKITVIALGTLLCVGQVQAQNEFAEIAAAAPLATLAGITTAVGVYNGAHITAAQHLWYMTKSYEALVGETKNYIDRVNDRYTNAFAVAAEINEAQKLSKMKSAASEFQKKYRTMDSGVLERFHSKYTAVYDNLEHFPMVFIYNNVKSDLSWAQWYMHHVGLGEIRDQIVAVAAKLEAVVAFVSTTEAFLQESILIKQEVLPGAFNIPQMFTKPLKVMGSTLAGFVVFAGVVALRGNRRRALA